MKRISLQSTCPSGCIGCCGGECLRRNSELERNLCALGGGDKGASSSELLADVSWDEENVGADENQSSFTACSGLGGGHSQELGTLG